MLTVLTLCSCNIFEKSNSNEPTTENTKSSASSSVSVTTQPTTEEETTEPQPTVDPYDEKVSNMSTKEKAGQVVMTGVSGYSVDDDITRLVEKRKVGGVILFGDNIESVSQLTEFSNQIKSLNSSTPLLMSIDNEGGNVFRLPDDVTNLPSAYSIAESKDTSLCTESGKVLGSQIQAFGFQTGFSPDMDIWSNPDNTVIGERSYGTNANDVCTYGVATLQGVMQSGAIAVAKHFPGHGDTQSDSHYELPVVTKTVDELKQMEFKPFEKAIENNVPAIMVAHILCTSIDSENPASLSKNIVTDILRDDMGFEGTIFSDDLTMGAITDEYSVGTAAVKALNAGCDMVLVCHGYDNAYNAIDTITEAVSNGHLSASRLDDAVKHILKLKDNYNVNSNKVQSPDISALNSATKKIIDALS